MPLDPAGLATASEALQTTYFWLGLTDSGDVELSGGSPAYARQDISANMSSDSNGVITITGPITFDIPSGATVAKFALFTASTAGTRGGIENLSATEGPYGAQGSYEFTSGSITVTSS